MVLKQRYTSAGAPYPRAPGRPRINYLYGQHLSRNFRSYKLGKVSNDPYADNPFYRGAKGIKDAYDGARKIIKEGKELVAGGAAAVALLNRNVEAPQINFG